jgi:hypothetical protein
VRDARRLRATPREGDVWNVANISAMASDHADVARPG